MKQPTPPYFGSAFYPEAWPASTRELDFQLTKKAGMNVMRMAEFSWAQLEPQEGQFDFTWLREVIDQLAQVNIATVLATPSATPPLWLTKKHPEILLVDDNNRPRQHGERCHWCPNQPVYRKYVARIVERMVQEFGSHPQILAWQIDNEPYPNRRGCCCTVCVGQFRDHVQKIFGTIEALNETWGTALWSQRYDSFDDLEAPRSDIWHHPSLIAEWMRFQSDSYAQFVKMQSQILHQYTKAPIGTDMMPMTRLNYRDIAACTDVMMFNHYPNEGELRHSQFWMSYVQSFKSQPFWVTESTVSNSSATAVVKEKGYRQEGYVRPLSWLPIIMGGEGQMYWLWRSHWSGQELTHGSVVDSVGRPTYPFDEVCSVGTGFKLASDFIAQTSPEQPRVGLHFSCDTAIVYEAQPLVDKVQYDDFYHQRGIGNGELVAQYYRPLVEAQYGVRVMDPSLSLEGLDVLISPMLLNLDDGGLRNRLKTWIKNGGTWVVGPMSDIRCPHGTKYTHSPFGVLEEWTGAHCRWQIIGHTQSALFQVNWSNGRQSDGRLWYDVFEVNQPEAEILGVYANGRVEGQVAAFAVPFGQGKIVVLGTIPAENAFLSILEPFLVKSGIKPSIQANGNLLVVNRTGAQHKGLIVAELENRTGVLTLPAPAIDLISGKTYSGLVKVEPYQVLVLKYN